jgi:hypothetical protein
MTDPGRSCIVWLLAILSRQIEVTFSSIRDPVNLDVAVKRDSDISQTHTRIDTMYADPPISDDTLHNIGEPE